jgi:phosphohistidine phosphatase SixA
MPEGDPKTLMRHLALDFRSWESLLLVGHEPYLSKLTGVLVADQSVAMDLKKGGLCQLQAASLTYGRCATLQALYPPKALRKISST